MFFMRSFRCAFFLFGRDSVSRKRSVNHLKAWRERAGYTQQEIADYLGIDRSTLA